MVTDLASQLRRDEGFRSRPYADTVGKITIGYGRNLDDVGISLSEADVLLQGDIQAATVALESHLPWTMGLDDARKGAVLNMVFNMGIGGLVGFHTMLERMQTGDYAGAAEAMLDSKWAEQVGPRAQRLALQVESGQWQ